MLSTKYFSFFSELSKNNNRTWFESHKAEFLHDVKQPFEALVADVIREMQSIDPTLDTSVKASVFRIYRDVRFSKDKTPYKTHMSAHITHGERAETGPAGLYFEVHANGGSIGGGIYQPNKEQLVLVRDLLMHEGDTLHKLLRAKDYMAHYPTGLVGEKNKVLSAEFKAAAIKEPLIYNKQYLWWADVPTSLFTTADAPKRIASYFKAAKPVSDFFAKALG